MTPAKEATTVLARRPATAGKTDSKALSNEKAESSTPHDAGPGVERAATEKR